MVSPHHLGLPVAPFLTIDSSTRTEMTSVPEEDEDFEEVPIVANFHAVVLLSLEDYCQKFFGRFSELQRFGAFFEVSSVKVYLRHSRFVQFSS